MKLFILILLFATGIISCNPKIYQQASFEKKCYQSSRGHLFAGNEICFYSDSTFKYLGHGPSIFVSGGNWKFNQSNEIELTSVASGNSNIYKNRIDTMWLDLTGKK